MINFCINLGISMFNLGAMIGLILGALMALRPLLTRLTTPQQRTILWLVAWVPAYAPSLYQMSNWFSVLPVTFRSLVVPRSSQFNDVPAFLPGRYDGAGDYNLALPGGALVQVGLNDYVLFTLAMVWLVGAVVMAWHIWKGNRALLAVAWEGELLSKYDPLIQNIDGLDRDNVVVRLCENLPTSFVRRGNESMEVKCGHAIYLQAQLPREQLRLVLLHEGQHIQLLHCCYKAYANFGLAMFWWNPLIWLGYRYFCRDMELACDAAVLRELEPGQRKEYAKTLVELGSGRQLWEAPLSFGECDAQLRVKSAVSFRPRDRWWIWREILAVLITIAAVLFFIGGPTNRYRPEDIALSISRGEGGLAGFIQEVEGELVAQSDSPRAQVEQLWCRLDRETEQRLYSSSPRGDILICARDGRWYQLFWSEGSDNTLFSPYELDQPPDLADCIQIW